MPEPPPAEIIILDDETLAYCAQQKWAPDEPVKHAPTYIEQQSRLDNYAICARIAGLKTVEGWGHSSRKAAIWAAVSIQVEAAFTKRYGRSTPRLSTESTDGR